MTGAGKLMRLGAGLRSWRMLEGAKHPSALGIAARVAFGGRLVAA
jgi:hypothetical protein